MPEYSYCRPICWMYAKSLQSCPTLCDPIDGSPPASPVPGILQARTLEWVAISFSNTWKWKVKVKLLSRVRPSATPWTAAYQGPPSMGFSRQGCHCLLRSAECSYPLYWDFPGGWDGKASAYTQCRRPRFDPWVGKIPWRRKWPPTPVLLPGKSTDRGAW